MGRPWARLRPQGHFESHTPRWRRRAPVRVLVVEEGGLQSRGLVEVLMGEGAEIVGRVCGIAEARRLEAARHPDLILIDARIADDAGRRQTIRRHLNTPVAVVVVGGSDRAALARAACDSARMLLENDA